MGIAGSKDRCSFSSPLRKRTGVWNLLRKYGPTKIFANALDLALRSRRFRRIIGRIVEAYTCHFDLLSIELGEFCDRLPNKRQANGRKNSGFTGTNISSEHRYAATV